MKEEIQKFIFPIYQRNIVSVYDQLRRNASKKSNMEQGLMRFYDFSVKSDKKYGMQGIRAYTQNNSKLSQFFELICKVTGIHII